MYLSVFLTEFSHTTIHENRTNCEMEMHGQNCQHRKKKYQSVRHGHTLLLFLLYGEMRKKKIHFANRNIRLLLENALIAIYALGMISTVYLLSLWNVGRYLSMMLRSLYRLWHWLIFYSTRLSGFRVGCMLDNGRELHNKLI